MEEEDRIFCPCPELIISEPDPHFEVASLTSGQGLGIKDEPPCPSFHITAYTSCDGIYELGVRRKNKCHVSPTGLAEICNRFAITNPVSNGSVSVLHKSRSALQRQYSKWAPDPWQQKEGIPITLTNLAAGSTGDIKSQRDNHYFIF